MTKRIYDLQDNAATHVVLDTGGTAQNGTASVNTSFRSSLGGPGNLLPRAFINMESVSIPGFTFWQPDFYSALAVWVNINSEASSAQSYIIGNHATAMAFGVACNDDGVSTFIGEDDSSDGIGGPDGIDLGIAASLHHLVVVFNPDASVAIYRDKILLAANVSVVPGGNLTINALFDGGVDSGNASSNGYLSGLVLDPVTASGWDQAKVNAEYARGVASLGIAPGSRGGGSANTLGLGIGL